MLGWNSTPSIEDFQSSILHSSKRERVILVYLLGCIGLRLWLLRNGVLFRNTTVSSPIVAVHRALILMLMQKSGRITRLGAKGNGGHDGSAIIAAAG